MGHMYIDFSVSVGMTAICKRLLQPFRFCYKIRAMYLSRPFVLHLLMLLLLLPSITIIKSLSFFHYLFFKRDVDDGSIVFIILLKSDGKLARKV